MSDSLNNKELVAVGYQFAKALSSNTPIIDMAKMFTRLAERLDCTTAALREMTKQRDALGAENAALKKAEPAPFSKLMMEVLDAYESGAEDVPELAMLSAYTKLRDGIKTPATDGFLADVRAQGVARFAAEMGAIHDKCQAGGYFDRQVQVYGKAKELAESYLKHRSQEAAQ